MPLKLIRLSGSLADESLPGYIGSDVGIVFVHFEADQLCIRSIGDLYVGISQHTEIQMFFQ